MQLECAILCWSLELLGRQQSLALHLFCVLYDSMAEEHDGSPCWGAADITQEPDSEGVRGTQPC